MKSCNNGIEEKSQNEPKATQFMSKEHFQVAIEDVASGAIIPPEMLAGLHSVAHLSADVLSSVSELVSNLDGLTEASEVEELIKGCLPDGDEDTAKELFRVVRGVDNDDVQKIVETVKAWAARKESRSTIFPEDVIEKLESNLKVLAQEHASISLMKKADRLVRDTGDELESIKFICDLRPVFDNERERVDALVLIANLRLRYMAQNGERESCELALTEAELLKLKEKTEEAIRKIEVLKRVASSLKDVEQEGGQE
jgi:hypothetical protein